MQLVLNPEEVATAGRVETSLEDPTSGIRVFHEGLDFGDVEIKAYQAEGHFGSSPIDHDWPARTIKIPLIIRPAEGLSFDAQRSRLEARVAEINNEGGGWLKRVLPSGKHIFADLVEAKLHLSVDWLTENRDIDRGATLELVAKPDLYEEEEELEVHEGTGDLAFTEVIKGTMPARVSSLIVTDTSGNDQKGLLWHFRGRNYDSAETAEWAYNAEALELLDLAEKATLSGSYGTKAVKHPNLSTEWTPVLGTTIGGEEFLTHVGVYDVWARVYSTSTELPWLRLLWDLGDMIAPSENVQVQVPGKEAFYDVYLGQINLRTLPFGDQRWKGVIYARGEEGGENVWIDRLRFVCADEKLGGVAGGDELGGIAEHCGKRHAQRRRRTQRQRSGQGRRMGRRRRYG